MSMDIVGKRGEALFRAIITRWCDGKQWFDDTFKGEKAEGLDFEVQLIGSSVFHANFYVQVKATAKRQKYAGSGNDRRLRVRLKRADAKKIGNMKVPAYVVGIDIHSGRAFIRHVPAGSKSGFGGIPVRQPLNCVAIKKVWNEVEAFWNSRPQGMTASEY